ncbi:MAG: ribbon-helix-helix domain-containing protein [Rhizobiales bacterium]|nr:ribbon-helix-helix domain-containing protein [Hyphomicrobiales bacterium]
MCEIFSKLPIEDYSSQTRSVRLSGHATSIRLEGAYWKILEELARKQDMSLGRFLSLMYDEVLELTNDEVTISTNFTSLLRCACLTYVSKMKDDKIISSPHLRVKQCVNS